MMESFCAASFSSFIQYLFLACLMWDIMSFVIYCRGLAWSISFNLTSSSERFLLFLPTCNIEINWRINNKFQIFFFHFFFVSNMSFWMLNICFWYFLQFGAPSSYWNYLFWVRHSYKGDFYFFKIIFLCQWKKIS